ncbi:MAG TPA: amidohydrolase family protein [Actinomycetota bacterium]
MDAPLTLRDAEVAGYVASLGLPGIIDVHTHFMPGRVQAKVWAHFDRLDPPWPIVYRAGEAERLATLAQLGVRHHTALAYAHRPGMAAWLNDHTLALAAAHPQVIGSFTFYPEPGVEAEVERALAAGGAVAKVHLQVGKFHALDPRLDAVWPLLASRRVPVVLHAGAVADGSGGEQFCGAGEVAGLLERHPDLVLIVAHLGAPDFTDFLDLAEAAPALRFDTAMVFGSPAPFWPFPPGVERRLGPLGDRILFGSDFPTVPRSFANQISGLAALGLGDDWLRAVLWHNAAGLLGRKLVRSG